MENKRKEFKPSPLMRQMNRVVTRTMNKKDNINWYEDTDAIEFIFEEDVREAANGGNYTR